MTVVLLVLQSRKLQIFYSLSETSIPRAGRTAEIPKNMFQDTNTQCFCFSFTVCEETDVTEHFFYSL